MEHERIDGLEKTGMQQPKGFRNEHADYQELPALGVGEPDEDIVFEADGNFLSIVNSLQEINPNLSHEEAVSIANLLKKEWFSEYARNSNLGLKEAYNFVLMQSEKLVRYLTEDDIIDFAKSNNIHRTILARLVDKWSQDADEKKMSPEFKKLVRVMVELGYVVYELNKKLVIGLEENTAKFTGVLKKAELFLKEYTMQENLKLIKEGKIHPSTFECLLKAYEDKKIVADDNLIKSAEQIVAEQSLYKAYFDIEEDLLSLGNKKVSDSLIDRTKFNYNQLNSLLDLYMKGERIDPGGCKEKIQSILALEIMSGLN